MPSLPISVPSTGPGIAPPNNGSSTVISTKSTSPVLVTVKVYRILSIHPSASTSITVPSLMSPIEGFWQLLTSIIVGSSSNMLSSSERSSISMLVFSMVAVTVAWFTISPRFISACVMSYCIWYIHASLGSKVLELLSSPDCGPGTTPPKRGSVITMSSSGSGPWLVTVKTYRRASHLGSASGSNKYAPFLINAIEEGGQ